ncbi:codanin-1 isoform X6 [Alligator mississippiensis]|uniref:codanin-1 isoform X6 n=1 Tax=Alligator mississippiensis TaxID=8496 RepID=UPI002877F1EE|nr:codanin-1 isoform X6 [Alligator mississippiensis]
MAAALELVLREEVAPGALVHWLKHDPGRRSAEENHIHEKLVSLSLPQKDFVPFFLNFLREQTGQILTNGPSTPAKTPNSKALGNSAGRGSQRRGSERRAGNTTGSSSSRMQLFTQKGSANSCSPDTSFAPSAVSGGSPAFTGSNLSSPSSDFPSVVSSVSPSFGCSPVFNHSERRSAQKANLGNFFVAMPEVQPTRRGRRKGNSSTSTSSRQVARDLGRCLADEEDGKSDNTSWSGGRKKRNEVLGVSASSPPDQLNLNNLEEFPPMCASSGFTNKSKPSRRINPTPVSIERPLSKPKMCFTSTPVSQSPAARFPSGASHEAFVTIQEGNVASTAGSSLQEEREMLKKERCKLLHQASSPAGLSLEPSTPTKLSYTRSASLPPEGHLMTCAYLSKVSCKKQLDQLALLYSSCIAENLVPNIFLELFFVLQLLTSRGISAEDGESDLEFNQGCKGAVERQHFHNVHNCVYFAVQVLDRQYELISHLEKGTLKLLAENERIASFSPHLHKRLRQAYESSTAKVSLLLPSSVQSVSFQPETDNRSNFPSDRAFHIFKKQRDIFYELLREWEDNHEKPAWDFERVLGNKIRAMMAHLTATCNHSHFARLFQKQIIQDEKKHFTVVLMSLRLLAKFLGFLVFLPYRTVEPPTRDLHESAVALRNQSLPVLDVLKLLQRAIQGRRTILTIPWIVEFLSLVDHIAPFLDYYGTVFSLLLQVYRWAVLLTWYVCCGIGIPRPPGFGLHVGCLPVDLGVSEIQGSMVPSEDKEMSFLNKLLILAVLGWLFQFLFQIPSVPEELFFTSEVRQDGLMMDTMSSAQALDSATLVDQQLLYTCCPYLGELRKLLASFVAGSGAKNGGFIRKITPTAAESLAPKPSVTQQKLQAELEQAFFHNQPPSLRRTVEFVAERVGSNCVKHIKATLVAELVKRAEVMLQEKVKEDNTNHDKLLDEVCTQLYEEGAQAFLKGREFCRKKGPEAVRVLLPEETSAAVLSSAEDIAVRLATEKACTWLSTNITALIKREVRTTFSRMLKIQGPSLPSEDTQEMKKDCPPGCQHHAPFPSEIINEIKDVLCIAVGPRDGDEAIHYAHLECLLEKLSQTLQCRKFMCPTSEQQLAKCTIELASLLVSDRIPIQGLELQTQKYPERQRSKNHPICNLLTSLLSVWKEDFVMLVPVQLIFSKKNVGYVAEAKQREWDLFLFMLHGLVEYNLMGNAEIESYLQSLQEFAWPSDFLKELETLSRVFESELHIEELRTNPCELVRQSLGAVTAQS